MGVVFPNKRRDLGGISFFGLREWPWLDCCCRPLPGSDLIIVIVVISMLHPRDRPPDADLFEVAVRVWCRVAAGVEVVVEVFFEAGELGWISWMNYWLL
jgi:hypothetical protein